MLAGVPAEISQEEPEPKKKRKRTGTGGALPCCLAALLRAGIFFSGRTPATAREATALGRVASQPASQPATVPVFVELVVVPTATASLCGPRIRCEPAQYFGGGCVLANL